MKKLTTTVLAVVLASSFAMVSAQKVQDSSNTRDIEGVVVTALGIKREKKALGYSTQSISAEDITKSPTTNFTSNLSGKVAGLNIKQSGNVGGSIDITLRGYRSMTGNNQPLFVIDGTPMLNNSPTTNTSSLRVDTGNTISDINPDDIAEMNVLKGAAATALYGARAANGAIIITTKKGKANAKFSIDVNSAISVSSINKETFAKYQSSYGQGEGYLYGSSSNQQFAVYNGQPLAPMSVDASYGAAFDPNLMVWQYTSFVPGTANYGKASPWVAAKHDPSFIFQTGAMYNNSFSIAKGNDVSNFRLSYQNVNGNDILPNTNLNKNALTGTASYKLADNLTANIYTTFVTQNTVGKNPTGYHGITGNFRQWWAVNVDMKDQRDMYMNYKKNYSWNILSPTNTGPQYWDNPYFKLYENYITDSRQRFAGNASLSWDVTKKINLLARASHDGYTYFIDERKAVGSLADAMAIGPASGSQPSGYAIRNDRRSEDNFDLIGTFKDDFFNNTVDFFGVLGSTVNIQKFYSNAQGTQGGLFVPGVYSVTNTAAAAQAPLITDTTKKLFGTFAQANFGILKTYYIDGTVRRDVSSALPTNNNAYWYYSTSLSAIISNWSFFRESNVFSFGKLRASYAVVGNDTGPDQLINQYTVSTAFGTPVYAYNTSAKNPNLKSEQTKSYEVGAELKFFKNRIGLDLGWFRNETFDQILALPVSYATGVAYKVQNVGNMRSEGYEIALNLLPIKSENFTWELNANWSNPKSKVTALSSGVENITLGSFQGGVTINASLNDDYGTIKGTDFVYDGNGNKIIGAATGKYVKTNTNSVLGNMQADWFGSLTNRFRYKNVELSFQIDWKQGGDIFSLDQYYGQATGLYPETVFLNDLGNPVRNTLANGGGLILPGVVNTGTATIPVYTPNNVRINAASKGAMGYDAYPAKQFVYDATYIKLREVAVTYTLPKTFFASTFVKGIALSLVGNNLWIIKKNLPYADPESGLSAGNVQGYQTSPLPTTRTVSFNAKLNF